MAESEVKAVEDDPLMIKTGADALQTSGAELITEYSSVLQTKGTIKRDEEQ